MKRPVIGAIAAIGRNRALGKDNKLLWQIPDDLQRFKELTVGHPVILGRKTFESIVGYLGGPLPNRRNIIITSNTSGMIDFVNQSVRVDGPPAPSIVVRSVEEALENARQFDAEKIFIGGGAQIYEAALPHTNKLFLTIIDDEKEADVFFPEYEKEFTKKTFEEKREWKGLQYTWVNLERP